MDILYHHFPTSGVDTWLIVPPIVAFLVSTLTSMGGISGAFLLLPFQMSVLHFTSPGVSATNFVYNIVAIPSGIWRYLREGRMAWPLAWIVILGTLPGVLIGYYLRVLYLPDPAGFKLFVGAVLLYIGGRLLYELTPRGRQGKQAMKALDERFSARMQRLRSERTTRLSAGLPADAVVRTLSVSFRRVEFEFWGQRYGFNSWGMAGLSGVVGVIGGTYGIGGGAIIAPFCVAVFGLPIYTVAGAALLGTFLTSVAGVVFYSWGPAGPGLATQPDWLLGGLFGIGGSAGMYCGARLQKFVPQAFIKLMLGGIIVALALQYILQFFLR